MKGIEAAGFLTSNDAMVDLKSLFTFNDEILTRDVHRFLTISREISLIEHKGTVPTREDIRRHRFLCTGEYSELLLKKLEVKTDSLYAHARGTGHISDHVF